MEDFVKFLRGIPALRFVSEHFHHVAVCGGEIVVGRSGAELLDLFLEVLSFRFGDVVRQSFGDVGERALALLVLQEVGDVLRFGYAKRPVKVRLSIR